MVTYYKRKPDQEGWNYSDLLSGNLDRKVGIIQAHYWKTDQEGWNYIDLQYVAET
jgi:hypothetical protein